MTSMMNALPKHPRAAWSSRLIKVVIIASMLLTYLVVQAKDSTAFGETGGTTALREIDPFRLVDTRIDQGFVVRDNNTFKVRTREIAEIPSDAQALAVTITVANATTPGYLVAFPALEDRQLASTMAYEAGAATATGAVITLNEWGNFDIFVLNPVDVIVDVTGAFVPETSTRAGRFVPITPDRVIDTRDTTPMDAGETATIRLPSSVPADATAAIVTLTTTLPNNPGYFTAFADGPRPLASNLNVSTPNSTRASTAIVPISNRSLQVYSSGGGNLVLDLVGYFTGPSAELSASGLFVPTTPKRRLDTRDSSAMQAGETRSFDVTGGVALGAFTMLGQGAPGYATLYANGTKKPETSSINVSDSQVVSNMAVSQTAGAGVSLFSSTNADYVFDQFGYFVGQSASADQPLAPKAPAPTTTDAPKTTTTDAPKTTTTDAPTSSGCSVSSLLVPSCGLWLGASTPARSGAYDMTKGLAEYESVANNTPDILHFYKTGAQRFPTNEEIALSKRSGKQRSLLLYNWKPSGKDTWRQIANGSADAEIATVAASLKKYPHKLFLNIYHEPEDQVRTATTSGMTAKDYAAMYRHVVDRLQGHGVKNAVFVWNVMGFSGWQHYLDALYPGSSYVDWMCYDPYARDNKRAHIGELVNLARPNIGWPGFYAWATKKAPGKPLMMCEWGVDLKSNSNPAGFLSGDITGKLAKYPMLKAMVYWNSTGQGNYRIDDKTSKGLAYGTAYRKFAALPIFNKTSTNTAP